MREISCADISALVERLCIQAATVLPDDLCRVIEQAEKKEESPVGKGILQDIVTNFQMAKEKGVPICQDTGMAVVFLEIGQEVHITGWQSERRHSSGRSQRLSERLPPLLRGGRSAAAAKHRG